MDKLLLFLLMIAVFLSLFALQTDEERAMTMLFKIKYALNYAVHAGAEQLDKTKLSKGQFALDPGAARQASLGLLEQNLKLDARNQPLADSMLKSPVDILAYQVINNDRTFPCTYQAPDGSFSAVLSRPGVVMTIRVRYPNLFPLLRNVTWTLHSVSEITF